MKALIQRALNRFGYEVRRLRPQSKAPLLNVLSLVVEDYLRRKADRDGGDFYFVQIGANNGISVDPMRPFIVRHHWWGVLVEPHPAAFARLVENYRGEPQLAFENAVIAEHDGVTAFYTPKPRPGLVDLTTASSFDRAAVARISRHYGTEVEELTLPALTIRSLLAKHGVRSLDLVQIDAEGFDDRVVAMFARAGVLPAILHFETGSLTPERVRACLDLLADLGYRVVTVGLDTVAYRQAETPEAAAPFGTLYGYPVEFPATDDRPSSQVSEATAPELVRCRQESASLGGLL
jgi:FkbM family methyltransferase